MGNIPSSINDLIRRKAASEWPYDFEMQKHVIEQQTQAYIRLGNYNHYGVPAPIMKVVRENAINEWPDDFEMQLHVIEQQVNAYISLYHPQLHDSPLEVMEPIPTSASEEWSGDFEGQGNVIDEQTEFHTQLQVGTASNCSPAIGANAVPAESATQIGTRFSSALRNIKNREKAVQSRLRYWRLVRCNRRIFDDFFTRSGGVAVLMVTSVAVSATVCRFSSLPFAGQVLGGLIGLAVGALWSLLLLYPNDEELRERIGELEREGNRLARGYYESLLGCGWESMTGINFESFLGTILSEQGYKVQMTKASGDQGVDLIVSKGNHRIAIQAKGYPSSTVGNKAVQEAHTGMRFYRCSSAVVITNSTYTRSARELAAQVGCSLIDSSQIYDLITGNLKLETLAMRNGGTRQRR